jgi:hypothetical protein
MARLEPADWWAVRRASSSKPSTYRCPLCGHSLHAMTEHTLIAPEGDASRRRHAHTECVLDPAPRGVARDAATAAVAAQPPVEAVAR